MQDVDAMRGRIEKWLSARLSNAKNILVAPLRFPTAAGNSAETIFVDYVCTIDGERNSKQLVLRRQKEGSELFLNSSLEFPWRMMRAVAAHTDLPVPPLVAIELDRSVLGSPFFLTELVEGQIATQSPNYNIRGWIADLPISKRTLVWRNGLQILTRIHAVDWKTGFSFLSDPVRGETGLPQYIHWIGEWLDWAKRARPQPVLDIAMDYLHRQMPNDAATGVLWGDSQPSNLLFRDDQSVACVLDWEMAALGPGEADLAWWILFDDLYSEGMGVTRLSGLPNRQQSIAIYEEFAGRQVRNMDYYDILALLRMAIIGIRAFDRLLNSGKIEPGSNAITHNPMTQSIARRLGLPVPEVGEDFHALVKAFGDP
jgi:aminoglycoside phosphotransferase (APT) family kinase protein